MTEKSKAAGIVGQRIRDRREKLGLSRKQLGERSGIDVTHLARIETGTGNPTLHKLIQIATAVDVTVADLVDGLGREHLPEDAAQPITEKEIIEELRRRRGGTHAAPVSDSSKD